MIKRIFTLLLAVLLAAGCCCAEETAADETNYVTEADFVETVEIETVPFTSEEGGYSINVPAGWEAVEGLDLPETGDASAIISFTAFCSAEGDKSLSIVVAPSGEAGIEDISNDVDTLTANVIGRMKNVTAAENNGIVTSGDTVYMYVGYIIDDSTTVDQYYRLLGENMVLVTFVNESDNTVKGAVLSTLAENQ